MSDHAALIARLRDHHWGSALGKLHEAADALEAQAARIAELEAALRTTRGNIASLGPAGAIPFEYREWLAMVDVAIAKALVGAQPC